MTLFSRKYIWEIMLLIVFNIIARQAEIIQGMFDTIINVMPSTVTN